MIQSKTPIHMTIDFKDGETTYKVTFMIDRGRTGMTYLISGNPKVLIAGIDLADALRQVPYALREVGYIESDMG